MPPGCPRAKACPGPCRPLCCRRPVADTPCRASYPLLLKQLLKHTSAAEPHHEELVALVRDVDQYVRHINEATRIAESDNTVARVLECLEPAQAQSAGFTRPQDICAEGSVRVRAGRGNRWTHAYMLLFTDALLLTKTGNQAGNGRQQGDKKKPRLVFDPLPLKRLQVVADPSRKVLRPSPPADRAVH